MHIHGMKFHPSAKRFLGLLATLTTLLFIQGCQQDQDQASYGLTPRLIATDVNTPVSGTFTSTEQQDQAGQDPIELTVYSDPVHGTFYLDENTGDFLYTPDAGFRGSDSLQLVVIHSAGESAPLTIDITVGRVLNDTGVTRCGNYAWDNAATGVHSNDLDCNLTDDSSAGGGGDPIPPGQDAHYGRDILSDDSDGSGGFSFTKLDENGFELASDAPDWVCVKDNVTGLIWEVKRPVGLHASDLKFTWHQPDGDNGGDPGSPDLIVGTAGTTSSFVTAVIEENLCGLANWRLPEVEELRAIAHLGNTPSEFIPINTSDAYWAATPSPNMATMAKNFYFSLGKPGGNLKSNQYFAILVAGDNPYVGNPSVTTSGIQVCNADADTTTPSSDFVGNGDGTVTHLRTGLTWQQCLAGQSWQSGACSGSPIRVNWKNALQLAEADTTASNPNWRLPNIKELGSIIEHSCFQPAFNQEIFLLNGNNFHGFWSSTPTRLSADAARLVTLNNGSTGSSNKNNESYVILVRD